MTDFATVQTHRGGQVTVSKDAFWHTYEKHFDGLTLDDIWSLMEANGRVMWTHRGTMYRLLNVMDDSVKMGES